MSGTLGGRKTALVYTPPSIADLTEVDVRQALDFLVAIEPAPAPDTREDYERAIRPYRADIGEAIGTLRRFAERTGPRPLDQMQREYYSFTNDPRYLVSSDVLSVVTSALNEAWDGVGPWRR